MHTLTLHTSRLTLIPFAQTDEDVFHRLNTDAFIRKFLWDDEVIPITRTQEVLQTNQRSFEEKGYGLWKVVENETKTVVGYTGLWFFFDEPQPQLMYALLKPYTGKGYASEASKRIVAYAFDVLRFSYLRAAMDEPHKASQRVASRIGMKFLEKRMENEKSTLFYILNHPSK